MIKTVFTDIDNTLLDFNKSASEAMKTALLKRGVEYTEEMFDVFLRINDYLWTELENGALTKEELHKVRFQLIFKELDIDLETEPVETEFRGLVAEIAKPVSHAEEMLSYLSSKYPVYAVSNASHNQQLKRLKSAGMSGYIKEVFTSEQIGCQKPAYRFFDECFKRIDNPPAPEEALIIGDSLSADICGGINYGMKTCWFNYKNEAMPNDIAPDYTIYSLKEMTKLL